jgi:CDP-diacylglycerol--glycerol-3-phosphate 3-phosphatidyltransferase
MDFLGLKLNPANQLTLLRILLIPFFMLFMFVDNIYTRIFALFIFIFASLTDAWDGMVARKRNIVTDSGKFLDPLADKMLISAALISFVELKELYIPGWMVVLIISREFMITGLRTLGAAKNKILAAEKAGKFKTTSQIVAIITILVILIVNSAVHKFWGIKVGELKRFSDWRGDLGWILHLAPFVLMFITTILTLISGIGYIRKNRELLVG